MFRIAAIVILSAATALTAVGWVFELPTSAGLESHSCRHGDFVEVGRTFPSTT
jgi:hypothetical protein